MARAVVERRDIKPFERTGDLAEVLKVANPAWEKGKNPATRAFQGLRIHVNNELGDLEAGLEAALEALEVRSEEHTSELQSLMRISYAVFCLKKKNDYDIAHI